MKNKISGFFERNNKKIISGSLLLNALVIFLLFSNHAESSLVIANVIKNTDNIPHVTVVSSINTPMVIEVVGEVNNPGIYRISKPIMVLEAIDLAGGLSINADMNYVHKSLSLSKFVANNEKIYIPQLSISSPTSGTTSETSLININTATADELDVLPGVGPVTAQKIISGRPYSSLSDLNAVDGISDSLYNNIVSLITI